MACIQIGAGLRRYDAKLLAAENAAKRFQGLPPKIQPGQALAALKRAARSIGASSRLVELIDLLFSWTKPQDWAEGQAPIVWPRNETLAEAMGLTIRQVQNLLRQGVNLGLLCHRDSPNGHRGGVRGPDGIIRWGYGIDLSPIGTRYGEFLQAAEAAALEARARDALRRRLTIARKSINQIAQTALERMLPGADWSAEVDFARMAADHARGVREIEALTPIVEQLEATRLRIHAAFSEALAIQTAMYMPLEKANKPVNLSCSHEADCADSTTTKHLQPANAGLRSSNQTERSGHSARFATSNSTVEDDLTKHRVDVEFVARVCGEITWELEYGQQSWGRLVHIAERVAGQYDIPRHAWHEACRVMGDRGAAAAVIATVHKYRAGEVRVPGAYLRGMTGKALSGQLQLGRTFHGLREASLQ